MKNIILDNEEKELLHSFEAGEWESVENLEDEINRHREIARNTLRKDKRINIRLSSYDLKAIKTTAIELGLP